MRNRKLHSVLGLTLALGALSVLVPAWGLASADSKPGDSGKPELGAAAPITWDEFRGRCLSPDKYDTQRAPQHIRVQCSDSTTEYVVGAPGQVQLAGSRVVSTTVLADKYYVAAGTEPVAVASRSGSCMRFKEVEKTLTIERPMSCAEIVNIKGSVSDYCASALDAAKSGQPKLVDVKETGKVIDTCGPQAGGGMGKEPPVNG